eukprot:COSAG02_NODE_353_length_24023_cov_77.872304_12_plen_91_part_00
MELVSRTGDVEAEEAAKVRPMKYSQIYQQFDRGTQAYGASCHAECSTMHNRGVLRDLFPYLRCALICNAVVVPVHQPCSCQCPTALHLAR